MNLFTVFNDVLNPEVMARIALYVDEPPEKTKKAVEGLVYTVFGGLLKRTTTEIGVNQLFNQIQRGHYSGLLSDNLLTILKDPTQTNTLITSGNETISHLLPAMKSSIGSMISSYAGIRNSSAISLLGLTTSLVLDVLGRQVRDRKLDADGLAASLFDQRETFVNAVPDELLPRLVEKVGIQNVMAGVAAPAKRTATVTQPVRSGAGRGTTPYSAPATLSYDADDDADGGSGSLAKWAVGALLALAVLGGSYYIYQNTQNYSGTEDLSDTTPLSTDTVKADTVARSLAVPTDTTTRPASVTATTASATPAAGLGSTTATSGSGALGTQLTAYLNDPTQPKGRTFPLSSVSFVPGTVQLAPGSETVINELATILKTYPSAQVRLVGYANDAQGGLTNKSLSFKRVNQIKQQLVNAGINYIRVDAVGLGSGVTVKPGDTTAVKRPSLRKIDMKVVIK